MRPTWQEYFMGMAEQAARRASCDRKHVGCVLVVDGQVASTGYNGAIAGMENCDEVGHLMEEGHCVRTVHAEMNAVAQAAKRGVAIAGATAYVTASPCWPCFKVLVNAGVKRIVFGEFYRDVKIYAAAEKLGIELVDLSEGKTVAFGFRQQLYGANSTAPQPPSAEGHQCCKCEDEPATEVHRCARCSEPSYTCGKCVVYYEGLCDGCQHVADKDD